ncbi:uncharacterized protein LOC110095527 isoform X2 [Dendrobium catenatum]|uniref:Coenzyme Q-binding protein COQ10 START domain-containing protein n=1 Tax=Dendrobium catenatum TaxID=906689 RepID=A0A2I0WHD2_9ASPA|nr:uncharacterized protein LOC110095527 isoform X2 [Dendrobium catenatum]PKU75074.1 hypothetical protein MA16_Dca018144 [Dendrobium catenatum]
MTAILSGPAAPLTCFAKAKKAVSFQDKQYHFLGRGVLFDPSLSSVIPRSSAYGRMTMKRKSNLIPRRPLSPVMEWQDCSSVIEAEVPCSVAYECYSNKELIPQWMPFISSVKVLKDKPDVSRWSLKYEVFGRDVELSWLARNMQPIPNQKIHWRSLEGLSNRGAVRFYPSGPSSCRIELTVSYEVPEILSPIASALKPFVEALLLRGLNKFAEFAREYQKKVPQS